MLLKLRIKIINSYLGYVIKIKYIIEKQYQF